MNARERTLAILLIGIMFLAMGGVGAYQFVYTPLTKNKEDLAKLAEDVGNLKYERTTMWAQQSAYENVTKPMSLPASQTTVDGKVTLETSLAQREYGRLLDRMLRKAKFMETTIKITPRAANNNNVPTVGNKRPIYTKLDFDLQVKGPLICLVDFMHDFYRQPLLHQIRTMNILKPVQSTGPGRGGTDLEITLAIEALVLDKPENRATLLPALPSVVMSAGGAASAGYNFRAIEKGLGTPFPVRGVLAKNREDSDSRTIQSSDDEYRRIAGKNIFFTPPPPEKEDGEAFVKEVDLAPYLEVVVVSHSEGTSKATIKDRWNNEQYEIEVNPKGRVTVCRYYNLAFEENGIHLTKTGKWWEKSYLEFGKASTDNLRRYFVRRILENQILLEEYSEERYLHDKGAIPLAVALTMRELPPFLGRMTEPTLVGKMYTWQVGQMLESKQPGKSMKPITLARDCLYNLVRPLDLASEPAVVETPATPLKPVAKLPVAMDP